MGATMVSLDQVDANADAQIVELVVGRQVRRDALEVVRGVTALRHLVARYPHADGPVAANLLADGIDDLEGEVQAALEVAAILVVPGVGERRQELRDRAAVRAVDLGAVDAGLAQTAAPRA